MKIVTKALLRYLLRRRSLSLLQLLGIACGVAAAVGMSLSAQASLASFTRAVEFLKGRATHSLERPAGPLEEAILPRLMADPAVQAFSPVLDRRIGLKNGEAVRLLGIDPFLDPAIRPELARAFPHQRDAAWRKDALSFLTVENAVLLDARLAGELGLTPGGDLPTSHGRLRMIGSFPPLNGEPLILMDIGHAQKLYRIPGRIDRVDLILTDAQGFASRWGAGFRIQSAEQRRASLGEMLRAFRLNLQALSLLALFVGIFLVYNTAMFAVVTRRKDAGILRSLGASRRELLLAFLAEILLLGSLGGALGTIGGFFLSRFLNALVADTISNLYFFLWPSPPAWSWWILLGGLLLGCGASLLGGIFPLRELVRADPVQVLRGRTASRTAGASARKATLAGAGILLLSAVLLAASAVHVYLGFAGAFGLLLGGSFFSGSALIILGPWLKRILQRLTGTPGKIAAGNILQNLGRTAVAVAAFMVALSMAVGLSSMIDSFRQSLIWWMGTQLRGDLYIGKVGEVEVPESFYQELRSMPGLGGVDPYRNGQVVYQGTPIFVSAVDAGVLQRFTHFGWLKGGDENWEPVKRGEAIISESFSRRFGVHAGDSIVLQGVHGPARLRVAAVFYDYTSEHGVVMMDRSTYLKIYADPTINSVGVFIDPGNPHRQKLLDDVRRRAARLGLPVVDGDQLRAGILSMFDTTFAVTRSMRILAIIVAFFGIAGALLTLFLERQKDFGIYRALGFSTRQVAGMTLMEGLGMGLVSFLMCTALGTALAFVLIRVINLRSFHWTIFFYPHWEPYLIAGTTAVLASLGASVYPILKVYRTYPQMQIREE